MIPNIFHFIFGMAADFGGRPFSISHYLAIKSAHVLNKPEKIYFHFEFEPSGIWWDKALPMLTLNKISSPKFFMGKELFHVAHKADIVRLLALKEHGGIYMDLDTICVKPFKDLLHYSFVIGKEMVPEYIPKNWRQVIKYRIRKIFIKKTTGKLTGLCNAILLSEKNSAFVNHWLNTYSSFRSKGRDKYWNEHSVTIPVKLSEKYPEEITMLNPRAFHYPLYNKSGLESMFEKNCTFPEAYAHHLWESFSWDKYLSKLTVESILHEETSYNLIARRFL